MSDSDTKAPGSSPVKKLTKDYGVFGKLEVIDISKDSENGFVVGLEMFQEQRD